jgi:hypothetical protein
MATLGLSKVFILDKYFTELQKFWETEKKLQGVCAFCLHIGGPRWLQVLMIRVVACALGVLPLSPIVGLLKVVVVVVVGG